MNRIESRFQKTLGILLIILLCTLFSECYVLASEQKAVPEPFDSVHIEDQSAGAYVHAYDGMQVPAHWLLRFYQKALSPQRPPSCRYHPSCSAYGVKSVQKHGAVLGSFLAGDRLLRCNPYNSPGDDPVPEKVFGD